MIGISATEDTEGTENCNHRFHGLTLILATKRLKRHKEKSCPQISQMGADDALRESGGDSLGIKTGRALSKRASSGSACFDPATLSLCEADWIYCLRGTIYYLFGTDTDLHGRTRRKKGGFAAKRHKKHKRGF